MIIRKIKNILETRRYAKEGYSQFMIHSALKELKENYENYDMPKKTKKWAYDRGYNPWRIQQYGLTEENYKDVISDRDYLYIYPLNNQYKKWIDDKLTMKYVLAPFDRYLPKYYYHLMKTRGVMPLMNCPQGYGPNVDGLLQLIDDLGVVAAKLIAGTHGVGFYKLEAKDGTYFANGKSYNKAEFKQFLTSLDNYIITEFIKMHSDMEKINPYAVNTLRVMALNVHGDDPIVPFAYMRIGTKKSGVVDNVSQGGMVCKLDVATGRYYGGEVLKDHVYESVECHPDTGTKLEGIVPHWELVKMELIKICQYCPQLRWLGFDVAITPDGFCIIEINSHQELHKAHEYPAEAKEFLFQELAAKKEKYGRK